MRFERRFTTADQSPYAALEFRAAKSEIRNPDGSVVFLLDGIEIPAAWSQVASDVIAQKYFRKAGVPARLKRVEENDVPSFLWRHVADEAALAELPEAERYGPEMSARQVFDRLAGTWTYWGWKGGYFDTEHDAQAFMDELRFMLAKQMAAPNSPQWFNTGLHWAYGIDGPSQGHYYVDYKTGELTASASSYEHPQPHACFIQGVKDDLVNEGGIMDLWVREARLFKYGSGTGSNFSKLRGENEKLSGGGKSSGLMSFLKIGDRAAGAIKSGGTTRRAAKMVVVDVDHPDIEAYIDWKVKEEDKVACLVAGSKALSKHLKAILKACVNCEGHGDDCFNPEKNPALKKEIKLARRAFVPDASIKKIIQYARQGFKDVQLDTYTLDWDSDAYLTVAGQNSNNSVRITDDFLRAVEDDGDWTLTKRITGKPHKVLQARELWDKIGHAAWHSADPGLQYHTTINDWHTCPAGGAIVASNPCSEYMFLDDTACNLASLNLLQFRQADKRFDLAAYEHAVRLWTVVLELSVVMAQFPSREIAQLSYDYRTLGLGYANIGGYLMSSGIAYDSDEGRAICGAFSAIMTGVCYATSAEMAKERGPFVRFADNREAMLRVMRNHRRAAHGEADGYEALAVAPVPLDTSALRDPRLAEHARAAWDRALQLGEQHGYRNAQVSVVAPTGTIGLVMDCDTTGIEPDFALVKFKKLAGGGYFKIINRAVPEALRALGYREAELAEIEAYAVGHASLRQAPAINHTTLKAKGFTEAKLAEIEKTLAGAFDIKFVFNKWTVGADYLRDVLKVPAAKADDPAFDLLAYLGFSKADIEAANIHVCGAMTVEGAPHLKREALPRVRLRQRLRPHRGALPLVGEPHPHDGGGAAVHLGRDLQDHQHAQRRQRRGLQGGLHALLAPRAEGQRALPRRLQAVAAVERPTDRRRGGRDRRGDRRRAGGAAAGPRRGRGREDRRARGRAHRAQPRPRAAARPPQGLHPEGRGRRPQGVPAHRRVPGRPHRRDLHRHAQGGRRLPQFDEQLRHRHLRRPAIRRAARRIRRRLHLHPLRAGRPGAGQRRHQERHVHPRLRVPRARHLLPRPQRAGPRRPQRDRPRRARRRRDPGQVRPDGRGAGLDGEVRVQGVRALQGRQADAAAGRPGAGHRVRCGAERRAGLRPGRPRRQRRRGAEAEPRRNRAARGGRSPGRRAGPRRARCCPDGDHRREAQPGADEGVHGRGLHRVRELHAGAQRDVPEVRHVRGHERV